MTFHNQHWFLVCSACPANQLWLCSLYLGCYSSQEKRNKRCGNPLHPRNDTAQFCHIQLVKFLTSEWDVFTFPSLGTASPKVKPNVRVSGKQSFSLKNYIWDRIQLTTQPMLCRWGKWNSERAGGNWPEYRIQLRVRTQGRVFINRHWNALFRKSVS